FNLSVTHMLSPFDYIIVYYNRKRNILRQNRNGFVYFVLGCLMAYRKDIRRSQSGFAIGKTTEKANLIKNHFCRHVRQKWLKI
ncbi:MAG: hypothetical protein Q3X28_03575, partial [Clostridia bacterium]|nr:hypothetical protein [Clostridia bacterium]